MHGCIGVHDEPPGTRAHVSGNWFKALSDASEKGLRAALGAASPEDSLREGARIFRQQTNATTPDMVVLSSALWWAFCFSRRILHAHRRQRSHATPRLNLTQKCHVSPRAVLMMHAPGCLQYA